jgi:WD40 repeat protein
VKIWDAKTFVEVASLPHEFGVFGLAISPDGRTIAAGLGCDGGSANPSNDHVVIWDVATRKRTFVFTDHQSDVRAAVFAPDGTLVTGSLDGMICRWNVRTGERLNTVANPEEGPVHCLAYSLDGSTLVSGCGKSAIVWDQMRWEPRVVLRHGNVVLSVTISPDCTTIATGNEAGFVELWDVASGTSKGSLLASSEPYLANDERVIDYRTNRVLSLAFSPDGTRLLSGSPEAVTKVWDPRQLPGERGVFTLDTTSGEMTINDSLNSVINLQQRDAVYGCKLEPGFVALALVRGYSFGQVESLYALGPGDLLAEVDPKNWAR